LGAANYLTRFPGASESRRYLAAHVERLLRATEPAGWLDAWQGADWGLAPQALSVASGALGAVHLGQRADELVARLGEATGDGTLFRRRGENPDEEELPVSAASFIEALGASYQREPRRELLGSMRAAVDWYLGANRQELALYDFQTGGCHDALSASGLNRNQGTEATAACLLSLCTLYELSNADVRSG
jgi:hypothetical protein